MEDRYLEKDSLENREIEWKRKREKKEGESMRGKKRISSDADSSLFWEREKEKVKDRHEKSVIGKMFLKMRGGWGGEEEEEIDFERWHFLEMRREYWDL